MTGWSFLIVAAGRGKRFGGHPKQFEDLGGLPLWAWSAGTAVKMKNAGVDRIVLVAPPGMETFLEKEASSFRKEMEVCVVAGGDSRRDSVLFGLKAAKEDMVMIHDAARPFVSAALCRRIMDKAGEEGSAIPALPVTDALKSARGGVIISSVPREDLLATQTPQAYPVVEIRSVLEKTPGKIRDEAEAWLASGRVPGWVRGDPLNFKITFPEDLEMARRMVKGAENVKTGLGFDVHPLVPGVPLVLGGVRIPFSLGLSAHSDGDLLCHAVADAILGAADLPDIGTLFPSSQERFKGVRSLDLLEEVVDLLHRRGYRVLSVDAVVNAQVPRLASMHGSIRDNLSKVLFKGGEGTVSLKFKSGEGTGDVGMGEAMRCWAIAVLRRIGAGAFDGPDGGEF